MSNVFEHEDDSQIDKESDIFDQTFFDELHSQNKLNLLDDENMILYEYQEEGKTKGIAVSSHDLESIKYGQYLNDTIINFYLKFLENEIYSSMKNEIYIFQSYFITKLISELLPKDFMKLPHSSFLDLLQNFDLAYMKVQRWIKTDIFKKKYLIIPLHIQDHWSLYIITNANILYSEEKAEFSPVIIYFDSFGLMNKRVTLVLKKFLEKNFQERQINNKINVPINKQEILALQLLVPRQQNYIDCGIYLLAYTEFFLENPYKIEQMIHNKEYILDTWFPKSYITLRRYRLGIILKRILAKQDLDSIVKIEMNCRRKVIKKAEEKMQEEEYDLFDKEKFVEEIQKKFREEDNIFEVGKINKLQLLRKQLDFYLNPQYANYEFQFELFK